MLVNDFNINLIYQETIEKKMISLNLNKVSIDDMFKLLSASLGVYVTKQKNIYYLGVLRDTDKSIFVSKFYGIDYVEMQKLLEKILDKKGSFDVFKNGVCVVRAQENSILNVKKVIEEIKNLSSELIRVQVKVHSIDKISNVDLFLKLLDDYDYTIDFKSFLKTIKISKPDLENVNLSLVDEILFYTELGKETKFVNGSLYPIKEVVISDNRVVESISYKSFGSETSIKLNKSKNGFLCNYNFIDTSILEGGENPIFKNFSVNLNGIVNQSFRPIGYFKRILKNKSKGFLRFKRRKETKYFIVSISAESENDSFAERSGAK